MSTRRLYLPAVLRFILHLQCGEQGLCHSIVSLSFLTKLASILGVCLRAVDVPHFCKVESWFHKEDQAWLTLWHQLSILPDMGTPAAYVTLK